MMSKQPEGEYIHVNRHSSWDAYPIPEALPPVIINDPTLPLVSIVTPSYNQGPFIRATIESVLRQDYPNIEYWIIDGGSSDETLAVLREYEHDPRLHWISEPDRGQADAVNKGWVRCRGEVLGWLNSDDTYLPGAINAQVQVLQAHPEVGLVYGDAIYIDEQGNPGKLYRTRAFNRQRFLHVSAIAQPSAFLRRRLLEWYGLLDIHLNHSIDFELFTRLMWETEFFYNKQTVATYRLHQTSKTVRLYKNSISESIAVVNRVCDRHADVLAHVRYHLIADWFWAGATCSLEAHRSLDLLAYSIAAIRTYPFSPRMLMVGLKTFDALFHTRISVWALAVCRRLGI
jgi:glycosyltransferase involved in cell wall biosynthesis